MMAMFIYHYTPQLSVWSFKLANGLLNISSEVNRIIVYLV